MTDQQDTEDFASMLAAFEADGGAAPDKRRIQVGDMVQAPVISIGDEAVFLELGGKSEGMLDRDQVCDKDGALTVAVGDIVEARVVEMGGASGCIVLRRSVGRGPDALADLAQAHEHGMPISGLVTDVNKGGVSVDIAGHRGFCPVSQLDLRFVEDPSVYVGQRLEFRITRLERGRGKSANIVVSRKALLEEAAAVLAEQTRERLKVGAVMRGTVVTIKPYGAFVDIGGLEGMLHISELGHMRVAHPSDVLSEGQSVEVQVLKIEKTGDKRNPERIGLSLKHLERDPWDDVVRTFPEGSRVPGKVVRLQQFGAFVAIAPGVEGLVHISELGAGRRINHPREVVADGDDVEVTVLGIDLERRRIALSIGAGKKSDADAAEAATIAAYKPVGNRSLGTLGDLLKNFKTDK